MWPWLWVFFRWESDTIIRSFEVLLYYIWIGYVDIEVNISVLGMFNEIPTYKPTIEYFTCLKTENDWEPIEYIGTGADVDWWSNRWKEELEEDMFLALNEYVESAGLSYDEPN